MADGLGTILNSLTGGGSQSDPNSPLIATNTQNIAAGIEGLHAIQNRAAEEFSAMSSTMQQQYGLLQKMDSSLMSISDIMRGGQEMDALVEEGEFSSGKKDPDQSDLQKLPDRYGMPALYIGSKLDKILDSVLESTAMVGQLFGRFDDRWKDELFAISAAVAQASGDQQGQATAAAGVEDKKKEEDQDKNPAGKKGIKDVFTDLMSGVGSIGKLALALLAFAGAALIFAAVNWGMAMVGLAMFGLFIAGSIMLIKLVAKNVDPDKMTAFAQFARDLSLGLILFGVAMAIMGIVIVLMGPAILGLIAMGLFFIMFSALGAMVAWIAKGGMEDFAKGTQKLSFSLLLFAVTMLLMPFIAMWALRGIIYALPIMAVFFLFALLGAFVAKVSKGGMKDFADGSFKLSLALLLFAATMVILFLLATQGFLGIVPPMLSKEFWKGPMLIMGVFLVFVALGALISKFSGELKKFAIGSILLTIALILFSLGLLVMHWVYKKMMEDGGPMVGFDDYLVPFSVILIMGLFVAFMALGVIASKCMGDLIKFAIASILMAIGLIVFAIALNMLIEVGQKIIENPLAFIIPMLSYIVLLAIFTVIGIALASGAIIGIALFAVATILMSVGLILFAVALNMLLDIGERVIENPLALAAALGAMAFVLIGVGLLAIPAAIAMVAGLLFIAATLLITPALFLWGQAFKIMQENVPDEEAIDLFLKMVRYTMGQFGFGMLIAAAKAIPAALVAFLATTLIAGVFIMTGKAFEVAIEIYEKSKQYDVEELMKPTIDLIYKISGIAKNLEGVSLESAIAFKIILDATLGGIERIVAMMDALADPKMLEKIPPAVKAFEKIIQDFFGIDPDRAQWNGQYLTLLGLMKAIDKTGTSLSEGQLRAAQALVPLTEALGNITDMIIKLQETDVDPGIASLKKMFPFMIELTNFSNIFSGGGWFSTSSEEQFDIANKSIQAMMPMIDSIVILTDKVSPLEGPAEEGVAATKQSIKLITELTRFADIFKAGGWFSRSSSDQFKVADDSIKAMTPMIDTMFALTNKATRLLGISIVGTKALELSKDFVLQMVDFAYIFEREGWWDWGLTDQIKLATRNVDAMLPLLFSIERLVLKATQIGDDGAFPRFGQSIREDVIDPLMEFDEAAKRVKTFEQGIKQLSTTLRDFVRDNQGTLRSSGNIFERASQFAINVRNAAAYKVGGWMGGGRSEEGKEDGGSGDPIESIAKNVTAIAKKIGAPGVDEWGGAVK